MNVGILTFHHAANYGAVWQTICLSKTITDLGHEVEVIDFRHPAAENAYRKHLFKTRLAIFNALKAWKLGRDLKNNVLLSPKVCRNPADLYDIVKRYDAVVVGSDEVWNIEGMRGWTPAYFLDFVPDDIRKISYAASTGHRINTSKYGIEMPLLLSRFDGVSVRDQTSVEVIRSLTGITPQIVVDPTLLSKSYEIIGEQKHVALYGGLDKISKKWLKKQVITDKIDLISIGFSNRVAGRVRIASGLKEWLKTIGSAQCVITTTFHGMMAAIVHNRPFWVLPRQDGATKVHDFLNAHGLQDRMLSPTNLPEHLVLNPAIDYDHFHLRLDQEIETSLSFLKQQLM